MEAAVAAADVDDAVVYNGEPSARTERVPPERRGAGSDGPPDKPGAGPLGGQALAAEFRRDAAPAGACR